MRHAWILDWIRILKYSVKHSRLCKSQFTIYRQRTMHIFILEGRRSGDCAWIWLALKTNLAVAKWPFTEVMLDNFYQAIQDLYLLKSHPSSTIHFQTSIRSIAEIMLDDPQTEHKVSFHHSLVENIYENVQWELMELGKWQNSFSSVAVTDRGGSDIFLLILKTEAGPKFGWCNNTFPWYFN